MLSVFNFVLKHPIFFSLSKHGRWLDRWIDRGKSKDGTISNVPIQDYISSKRRLKLKDMKSIRETSHSPASSYWVASEEERSSEETSLPNVLLIKCVSPYSHDTKNLAEEMRTWWGNWRCNTATSVSVNEGSLRDSSGPDDTTGNDPRAVSRKEVSARGGERAEAGAAGSVRPVEVEWWAIFPKLGKDLKKSKN